MSASNQVDAWKRSGKSVRRFCFVCNEVTEWTSVTVLPRFLFNCAAAIIKCNGCGLGATDPAPSANLDYYADNLNYEEFFLARQATYDEFAKDLFSAITAVDQNLSEKSILDVGAGGGFFVGVAHKAGMKAFGIEPNTRLVKYCQNKGLSVTTGNVSEAFNLPLEFPKAYDFVVLSAVLEHLPDPVLALNNCLTVLRPGGEILVSQACYDGLLPRLAPWLWYGWQPREHFWHFTLPNLIKLAEQCDLKDVSIVRNSLHHPWFYKGSLQTLIGRNVASILGRVGCKCGYGDQINVLFSRNE